MPYELFDHTADLGLRVVAPDLDTLFADAAACLTSAMLENPEAIRPAIEHTLEVAGTDPEYLLFDWLRELLHRYEDGFLYSAFAVRTDADGLKALLRGEPIDRGRHQLSHEVKAITYHELKVERTESGWLAEAIVDI